MYSVAHNRNVSPAAKQIHPNKLHTNADQFPSTILGDEQTTGVQLATIQNAISFDRALNQKSTDKFRVGSSAVRGGVCS
jgi:hypothetical protein